MANHNFASILYQSAEKFPDKVALITEEATLTYSQLAARTNQAGNLFKAEGIEKGDRVAILFSNNFRYFEIVFGLMAIGAVPVPINAKQPSPIIEYIIKDSGSKILVFTEDLYEKVQQIQENIQQVKQIPVYLTKGDGNPLDGYDKRLSSVSSELELEEVEKEDICFLPYTSGSTGNPKGCILTHEGQFWNVQASSDRGVDETDRLIVSLPLYHKNAMATMKMIFYVAASAVILEKVDIPKILESIEKYKCTFITGVPALYQMIVNYIDQSEKSYDFSSLRFISCGSSEAPKELLEKLNAIFNVPVYEGYGLTEGGPIVTSSKEGVQRIGSAGKPVKDCEVKIVDEYLNPVKKGEKGELIVKNLGVAKGYWNLPEVTAKKITKDGWLRTGDIAWEDEDGFIYIVGRKDDMINVGGENVYPKEVENILLKLPEIAEAAVIPKPHGIKGEVPVAFVVFKEGKSLTPKQIKDYFIENGPVYAYPREVIVVDEIPLTGPGKIDRITLKNKLKQYELRSEEIK